VKISAALPSGVAALLFEAAAARRALEANLTAAVEAAGYAEVVLPIVDYLEPYEGLLGAAARRELYRLTDRSGEALLVRADFTPLLARLLAPRAATLGRPLRLYYRGDVVRAGDERPGAQRELYQLGAELLGIAGEEAEAEVLRLFVRLLAAAGVVAPTVVLGFAGALDELLLAVATPAGAAELAAAVARREREVVRVASPALFAVVEQGRPADPADLGPLAGPRLASLLALRDAVAAEVPGVSLTIDLAEFADQHLDPRLRNGGPSHGRRYYDGLVLRAFAGGGGEPVGGGGRYDGLFRALGAELPAVGFSLSLDHLLAAREGAAAAGSGEGPTAELALASAGERPQEPGTVSASAGPRGTRPPGGEPAASGQPGFGPLDSRQPGSAQPGSGRPR
jgi:ATP phosphoribosyltransferase regulatory subunit